MAQKSLHAGRHLTNPDETQGQVRRRPQVFGLLEENVRGTHCDGMAGIIEEGTSVMDEHFDDATMDACLTAAGQRADYHEIAAYGTLVAWASELGFSEQAALLRETLDDEKAADGRNHLG